MPSIKDIRNLREHFHDVRRMKIMKECFTRPSSKYLADLYLLVFFTMMFAWLGFYPDMKWALIPAFVAYVCLLFRIDAALASIYPNYYTAFPMDIAKHRVDFRLLRYLKFSEKLKISGLSEETVSACLKLAQKEHELTEFQSVSSRPLILWLSTLLGALIAGAAGIESAWVSKIIPFLIFLVLVSLSYAFLFSELFRPRRFAEKEFELFLYWYCNLDVPKTP